MINKTGSPVISEFLSYLAGLPVDEKTRIPSIAQLSKKLGISVATLREQLEVARFLGIVEVKPKTGIQLIPYQFTPTVFSSLVYAIQSGQVPFESFIELRKHLESAYFIEAASSLTIADIDDLMLLVRKAQIKISSTPLSIPVIEHREFHKLLYRHIQNPFFVGIINAYWEYYHKSGLETYFDAAYHARVWKYHERIITLIKEKNLTLAHKILLDHMEMIFQRERETPRLSFE